MLHLPGRLPQEQAAGASTDDPTARRRPTLFKSKTPTLLTATALVLGVLGAAPLAHAGVPQKHPDGLGIPQKHPDIIAIPQKHPDIIAIPRKHPDGLGIPQKHPDIIGVLGRKTGSATGRKAGGDPKYRFVRNAGGHQEDLTVRKAGGNQE